MTVGGTWFGQATDFGITQPLVAPVQELVGGTVTVFQRMPGSGDMLRIATNVRTLDGTRATGALTPEFNPWAIIAQAPEADLQAAQPVLAEGQRRMTIVLVIIGATTVAALFGSLGSSIGARRIGAIIGTNATAVARSGTELSQLATDLDGTSQRTAGQAVTASSAAEQVGANVSSVATAIEELDASVREVARQAAEASNVASGAVATARETNVPCPDSVRRARRSVRSSVSSPTSPSSANCSGSEERSATCSW